MTYPPSEPDPPQPEAEVDARRRVKYHVSDVILNTIASITDPQYPCAPDPAVTASRLYGKLQGLVRDGVINNFNFNFNDVTIETPKPIYKVDDLPDDAKPGDPYIVNHLSLGPVGVPEYMGVIVTVESLGCGMVLCNASRPGYVVEVKCRVQPTYPADYIDVNVTYRG